MYRHGLTSTRDGKRLDVHVVIMGCGRVGSTLAHVLETSGHSVAVVDQNPDAFRRLPPDFEGATVTGIGFDRDVLREAGIERAGGFAAVSSGDNSNIIAARVARETFGIENVVARIYDPGRAEVYQRLGISTVATVRWAADRVLRRLLPEGAESEWVDPRANVRLAEVHVAASWIGSPVAKLEAASGARVAFLTRYGDGILPTSNTIIQDGDLVHVIAHTDDTERVAEVLARAPEEEA